MYTFLISFGPSKVGYNKFKDHLALTRGKKTYEDLDKNHIQSQTMGDSFYQVL